MTAPLLADDLDLSKLTIAELIEQKAIMERLAAARLSQDSLIAFSRFMEPDPNYPDDVAKSLYSDQPHHHVLAEHSVTITDGTNILLNGSADFVMVSGDTLTLIQRVDGKWYEVGRGNN